MDVRENLAYADMGHRILPIGLDAVPVFSPYCATTDPETLTRWGKQLPGANTGIVLDGLLLVDADSPAHAPDGNGPDGVTAWRALGFDVGQPVIVTPTKGENSIFRLPKGAIVKCGAGALAPGIDIVTGAGRFALVPSSQTARGPYQWDRPLTDAIPYAPAGLLKLLRDRKRRQPETGIVTVMPTANEGAVLERLAQAAQGTRNDELNRAAYLIGRLVAAGRAHEGEALAVLVATGRALGLGAKECEKTALSGLRAGKAATGTLPTTAHQEHAYRVLTWAQGRGWPGRTGTTDLRLTIAHALLALRANRTTYDASVRELAELAGASCYKTAATSTKRLAEQNIVRVVQPGKPFGFRPGEYQLVAQNDAEDCDTITHTPNIGGDTGDTRPVPILGVCVSLTQGHDVWCYKGLGAMAGIVWESLRRDGPGTVAELAERTGKARRTVERAVNKLVRVVDVATGETAALVTKDGATYTALDIDLNVIAKLLHVDGTGAAQRARHEREREAHVRSWEIERMRQYLGNLPTKGPRAERTAQRQARVRVGAIKNVREHGAELDGEA